MNIDTGILTGVTGAILAMIWLARRFFAAEIDRAIFESFIEMGWVTQDSKSLGAGSRPAALGKIHSADWRQFMATR